LPEKVLLVAVSEPGWSLPLEKAGLFAALRMTT